MPFALEIVNLAPWATTMLKAYAHHHPVVLGLLLFWAWASTCLIVRLWLVHRKDSIAKKLGWSLILCVPFGGWIFYGAFHSPLPENSAKAAVNDNIMMGGH